MAKTVGNRWLALAQRGGGCGAIDDAERCGGPTSFTSLEQILQLF